MRATHLHSGKYSSIYCFTVYIKIRDILEECPNIVVKIPIEFPHEIANNLPWKFRVEKMNAAAKLFDALENIHKDHFNVES